MESYCHCPISVFYKVLKYSLLLLSLLQNLSPCVATTTATLTSFHSVVNYRATNQTLHVFFWCPCVNESSLWFCFCDLDGWILIVVAGKDNFFLNTIFVLKITKKPLLCWKSSLYRRGLPYFRQNSMKKSFISLCFLIKFIPINN